jgi:hypothetical protein
MCLKVDRVSEYRHEEQTYRINNDEQIIIPISLHLHYISRYQV